MAQNATIRAICWRPKDTDCPDCQCQQRRRLQPSADKALGRLDLGTETQRIHPQDRVGADLCHDRKQGSHWQRRIGIAGRQPKMQRQDGRLDAKDQQQQDGAHPQQRGILGRKLGHADSDIGHVQRARHRIDRAKGEQEQG